MQKIINRIICALLALVFILSDAPAYCLTLPLASSQRPNGNGAKTWNKEDLEAASRHPDINPLTDEMFGLKYKYIAISDEFIERKISEFRKKIYRQWAFWAKQQQTRKAALLAIVMLENRGFLKIGDSDFNILRLYIVKYYVSINAAPKPKALMSKEKKDRLDIRKQFAQFSALDGMGYEVFSDFYGRGIFKSADVLKKVVVVEFDRYGKKEFGPEDAVVLLFAPTKEKHFHMKGKRLIDVLADEKLYEKLKYAKENLFRRPRKSAHNKYSKLNNKLRNVGMKLSLDELFEHFKNQNGGDYGKAVDGLLGYIKGFGLDEGHDKRRLMTRFRKKGLYIFDAKLSFRSKSIDEEFKRCGTSLDKLFTRCLASAKSDANRAVVRLLKALEEGYGFKLKRKTIILILRRKGMLDSDLAINSFALVGQDGNKLAVEKKINRAIEKVLLIAEQNFYEPIANNVRARDLLIAVKRDIYEEGKLSCELLLKYSNAIRRFKIKKARTSYGTKVLWDSRDKALVMAWRNFFAKPVMPVRTKEPGLEQVCDRAIQKRSGGRYFGSVDEFVTESGLISGFSRVKEMRMVNFDTQKVKNIIKNEQQQLLLRLSYLQRLNPAQIWLLTELKNGRSVKDLMDELKANRSLFSDRVKNLLEKLNMLNLNYAVALLEFNEIVAPECRVDLSKPQMLASYELETLIDKINGSSDEEIINRLGFASRDTFEVCLGNALIKTGAGDINNLKLKIGSLNAEELKARASFSTLDVLIKLSNGGSLEEIAREKGVEFSQLDRRLRFLRGKIRLGQIHELINIAAINLRCVDMISSKSADLRNIHPNIDLI